jgi:hypothetical protein
MRVTLKTERPAQGLNAVECISAPAGEVNDDRAGYAGGCIWAIDGATDCAPEKYLPGKSDAAWLAEKFHGYLLKCAGNASVSLPDLLEDITASVRADFQAEKLRGLPARMNQPSAAALIARLGGTGVLETVAIGDCQLFVAQPRKPAKLYSAGRERLGDKAAIERVRAAMKEHNLSWSDALTKLLPSHNEGRNKMNLPGGYAVLSIDMAPRDLLIQEAIPLERGARLLLATDGFTRLYEVFGAYTEETLLEAAFKKGLAALLKELRTLEAGDAACEKAPRMKPRDDATAILAIAE